MIIEGLKKGSVIRIKENLYILSSDVGEFRGELITEEKLNDLCWIYAKKDTEWMLVDEQDARWEEKENVAKPGVEEKYFSSIDSEWAKVLVGCL